MAHLAVGSYTGRSRCLFDIDIDVTTAIMLVSFFNAVAVFPQYKLIQSYCKVNTLIHSSHICFFDYIFVRNIETYLHPIFMRNQSLSD